MTDQVKTAKFTDLNIEWEEPTRKNGRRKPIFTDIEVEDTLHPISITFQNTTKVYYTRGMEAGRKYRCLYNEDGTPAKGIWQHGREGSKSHTECIELNELGKLVTISSYASGQIKDQKKYLKAIL
jgi:hypothetical protein